MLGSFKGGTQQKNGFKKSVFKGFLNVGVLKLERMNSEKQDADVHMAASRQSEGEANNALFLTPIWTIIIHK